ncbi:unnamed protein product [Caenorhabditis sp. 36 PRJEB53466]|nr:unnamed protein product [Caenorhabditis sp. 36 PRJEB53466]
MQSPLCFVLLPILATLARISHSKMEKCEEIQRRFTDEENRQKQLQPVCSCSESGFFVSIKGPAVECEAATITALNTNLASFNHTELGMIFVKETTMNTIPNDFFAKMLPKRVKIEKCDILSVEASVFKPAADVIESLSLRENRITTLISRQFWTLHKMISLDVSHNKIDTIEEGAFEGLENLQEMILAGNDFRELKAGSFEGLRGLRKLNLENCNIQKIQKGAFRGLDSLEVLIISENLLETLDGSVFNSLKKLKILDLGSNRLRSMELRGLKSLEKLLLNNNQIETMKAIKLKDLPNLIVAMIDRNKIRTLGDMDMLGFSRSERIETLSFAYNNISTISQKAFQHLPHLKSLLLQNNDLEQLSINSAPFLTSFKSLVTLQVSANNLTVIRAGELPKSLLNLALDHNMITRIEPRALEGMALKRIYLHSNKLQFLYQGAFDSFAPTSVEAIDVSLNNWQCVCKDPKEWLPRWLSEAEEADVSEGPVGCLAIPGCGHGGESQEFEEEEESVRAGWITVAAIVLTIITIVIMITIAMLYFKDYRHQFPLRGRRCDSDLHKLIENDPLNIASDSILVVPTMPRRNPTNGPKKTTYFCSQRHSAQTLRYVSINEANDGAVGTLSFQLVKTKEIKTTTTTDESGHTVVTTSEAVHPGATTISHGASAAAAGGAYMQNSSSSSMFSSGAAAERSYAQQQQSSFSAGHSSSGMESSQLNSGGYASIRHATGERERGDSVEKFYF